MKIVPKFKNYCPVSVGSIDIRYDNKNPAEVYPSTTWELLTAGKYIQSGNTALQVGGSNSVSILKEHLPNVKLNIDSFKITRGNMEILGDILINVTSDEGDKYNTYGGAFYKSGTVGWGLFFNGSGGGGYHTAKFKASRTWSGESSSAAPYTQNLGNGTALSIQPSYITLKFWKRLT